ncbi:MAG: hypothetical protein ACXW14_09795 [Burkholderiaceae bacterium]
MSNRQLEVEARGMYAEQAGHLESLAKDEVALAYRIDTETDLAALATRGETPASALRASSNPSA